MGGIAYTKKSIIKDFNDLNKQFEHLAHKIGIEDALELYTENIYLILRGNKVFLGIPKNDDKLLSKNSYGKYLVGYYPKKLTGIKKTLTKPNALDIVYKDVLEQLKNVSLKDDSKEDLNTKLVNSLNKNVTIKVFNVNTIVFELVSNDFRLRLAPENIQNNVVTLHPGLFSYQGKAIELNSVAKEYLAKVITKYVVKENTALNKCNINGKALKSYIYKIK